MTAPLTDEQVADRPPDPGLPESSRRRYKARRNFWLDWIVVDTIMRPATYVAGPFMFRRDAKQAARARNRREVGA